MWACKAVNVRISLQVFFFFGLEVFEAMVAGTLGRKVDGRLPPARLRATNQ